MPISRRHHLQRARLLWCGLLAVAVALLASCGGGDGDTDNGGSGIQKVDLPPAQADAPNIVVVMTDDQAIRSIGLMPTVRRELAAKGLTFQRSFATTPQCCPSRVTYLTGQYSHNHGVPSSDAGYAAFEDRSNILPVWLQSAGYRTAHVGKYVNGYGIAKKGSDPTEVPEGWSHWVAPVDHTEYQMYGYTLNRDGELDEYGSEPEDYQTDVLTDESVELVRDMSGKRPFFLSVAPVAPHSEGVLDDKPNAPRNPRPAPRHRGDLDSVPFPDLPSFGAPVKDAPASIARKRGRKAKSINPATLRAEFLGRAESLLAVDDMVEDLLAELRAQGELENTYFVFTSDNGFLLGEHGLKGKELPYEESARVPLIIRGPDVPAGGSTSELVGNIDLAPTIAELASAEVGRDEDGVSLTPAFSRDPVAPGRSILLEFLDGREAYTAIRTDDWMYAEYENGGSELYNLARDPFELDNLTRDPASRAKRDELDDRLDRLSGCAGADCR